MGLWRLWGNHYSQYSRDASKTGDPGSLGYLEGWMCWWRVSVALLNCPRQEKSDENLLLCFWWHFRSPDDVTNRLDHFINDIRDRFQRAAINDVNVPGDVLVVAHGHILRALAMRWLKKPLADGPTFLMEAGGVGTLRFVNNNYPVRKWGLFWWDWNWWTYFLVMSITTLMSQLFSSGVHFT